ncbi:ATP-binding protein [Arvimicrobium flavum]|uniref:ATP-binding protein n=1 Tax=Arvimicrobium flavum TaxID=3393320 RepID=UPI00237B862C|nr:ATP-binding protein [Mesorhizobium shangrilense]
MAAIWETLLSNLALVSILVVAWDLLSDRTAHFSRSTQSVFLGLIMGVGAAISMAIAEPMHGFLFDLRMPLLAASAFFGGLPAIVVAASAALICRLYLGGPGVAVGVTGILIASVIGLACYWLVRSRQKTMTHIFGFGVAVAFGAYFGLLVLPEGARVVLFPRAVLPLTSLAFVSALMIGTLLHRMQRRRELATANLIYRAMVRELPDCLNVKDLDGRFIVANPATASLMRAGSAEELIGKTDFDFYPTELAQRFRQDEIDMLQSGEVQRLEQPALFPDGSQGWLTSVKAPFTDETGRVVGIITYNRDISDQKRVAQLKNEFISTVSHELRTPLTSIRGSLGLIAAGVAGELPAKAGNLVKIAHTNSERLVLLINDILDMEKIESGKVAFELRPMAVRPIVEQAIAASSNYMPERKVRLLLVDDAPRAGATIDPDRLHQVLSNLLSNAIKFSSVGDTVTVRLARRSGGVLRISVVDRGAGIPEAFRARVFGKFEQADASSTRGKGGTGLGLSIAKAIIEKLGGAIAFETQEGHGTAFHIDLPEASGQAVASATPSSQPHSDERNRVLICEDDADISGMIAALLDADGFSSDVAPDIASAKMLLQTRDYVALTLDIRLAGESGITLFRDIRKSSALPDIPVIVISAVADEAKRALNGSAVGIIDWLEKPVDPERLHAALGKIARRADDRRSRVLHVEDDESVLAVMSAGLGPDVSVTFAKTLKDAQFLAAESQFDLVILDVGLPDGSGLDLLTDLPAETAVIVFSAAELDQRLGASVKAVMTKTKASELDVAKVIKSFLPAAGVGRFSIPIGGE